MTPPRRYFVANGAERHPLKEWVRQHPEVLPPGFDPNKPGTTTHQMRDALKRVGWTVEETDTEVHLIPPDGGEPAVDRPHTRVVYNDAQTGELQSVRLAARPEYGEHGELRVGGCFWKRGMYVQVIDEVEGVPEQA
jgi:hypothetical protein